MATKIPDTGDRNRGNTEAGRVRTDEVLGRPTYSATGVPGDMSSRRSTGRDFYREALSRASRREAQESSRGGFYGVYGGPGRQTGLPADASIHPGMDSSNSGDEHRAGYLDERTARSHDGQQQWRAREDLQRFEHDRDYDYNRDFGSRELRRNWRPLENEGRSGPSMDMDDMARRYHHRAPRVDHQFHEGRSIYSGQPAYASGNRGEDFGSRAGYERVGFGESAAGWGETSAYGTPDMGASPQDERLRPMHRERRRWHHEPLTAAEVMTRDVATLRPDQTLREAAQVMRVENVGILPVVDANNRLLGLLTDRDIVVRAVHEDRQPSQVQVGELMSDDLDVVTENESLHDVIELMGRKQIRRVPVVERDNRLVGIIALADVATRADRDEELQDALERISARRSFWHRFF